MCVCVNNHWAPGRVAFRLKATTVKIRILYLYLHALVEYLARKFMFFKGVGGGFPGDSDQNMSTFQKYHMHAISCFHEWLFGWANGSLAQLAEYYPQVKLRWPMHRYNMHLMIQVHAKSHLGRMELRHGIYKLCV